MVFFGFWFVVLICFDVFRFASEVCVDFARHDQAWTSNACREPHLGTRSGCSNGMI